MQCPNCGFENIPGRTSCGVCSASLVKPPERESVMPKRARDRKWGETLGWFVQRSVRIGLPTLASEADRLPSLTVVSSFVRRSFAVLLSIVPGVGFLWSRSYRNAALSTLSAAGCVAIAIVFLHTRLADLAALTFAGLSVASIVAALDWAFPPSGNWEARIFRRIARSFLTACVLTTAILVALTSNRLGTNLYRMNATVPSLRLERGDGVLVLAHRTYQAGDVVLCRDAQLAVINTARGGTALTAERISRRVYGDEYGISYIQWYNYGHEHGLLQRPDIVDRSWIVGRLTLVYNPPERRGWLRRNAIR